MENKIKNIIAPDLESDGYEIVELKCAMFRNSATIRLFIDKHSGITVEDCSRVSKTVRFLIGGSEIGYLNYTLEVSSPGLDRNLKTKKDFLRHLGKSVAINLSVPIEQRYDFEGKISGADEQCVMIEIPELIQIPLEKISRAKLKITV